MKDIIIRPIVRLLRYELLLKNILEETPPGHDDRDTILAVLDVIKRLGKETERGVVSAKQKVELWRYNANLVFKVGENIVCFGSLRRPTGRMLTPNRTWICSTRTDH